MRIPKYPETPMFSDVQLNELTDIVFLSENEPVRSDIIFVFGSTHTATFLNTLRAYQLNLGSKIMLTGGRSTSRGKHKDWTYEDKSESRVMFEKLVNAGVPSEVILYEEKSTNSLENILYAMKTIDFSTLDSMVFVSKNYAAGRQYRTLKKYLPSNVSIRCLSYDTTLENDLVITRDNWMNTSKGRSLVFGEYLRMVHYGNKGDIEPLDKIIKGIDITIPKEIIFD